MTKSKKLKKWNFILFGITIFTMIGSICITAFLWISGNYVAVPVNVLFSCFIVFGGIDFIRNSLRKQRLREELSRNWDEVRE